MCVHVSEKLGQASRVDDEVEPCVYDFRGEREASEQEEVDFFDADTYLGRVVGRVERVRQHRGQRVVRVDQHEGVGGELLDLVRSGRRVAADLEGEAVGSLVGILLLVWLLAVELSREREASRKDVLPVTYHSACCFEVKFRKVPKWSAQVEVSSFPQR